MAADRGKEITGFVHNLSPVRNGASKKYFDFILQTDETSSIRGVCFSPPKRKLFADAENQSRPVKIKKFAEDAKDGSSSILMNDVVRLELLNKNDVDFEKKAIDLSHLNLSMLPQLMPQQLISVKAKVIHLTDPENVTTPNFSLDKVDGTLVDELGTVKITLWGSDISKVENGNTYDFTNLRLKKNKMNGELYVNPAKGNSSIQQCDPLPKTLDIPEIPEELTTQNVDAQVVGVSEVKLDYSCLKCKKSVESRKITKCQKCNLVQQLDRCKKSWYVTSLVELDNGSQVHLTFHEKAVSDMVRVTGCSKKLSEEVLTEAFLTAPKLHFVYNTKNVVKEVKEVNKVKTTLV